MFEREQAADDSPFGSLLDAVAEFEFYVAPDPLAFTADECDEVMGYTAGWPDHLQGTWTARLAAVIRRANDQWGRTPVAGVDVELLRYDPGTGFPEHTDMHPVFHGVGPTPPVRLGRSLLGPGSFRGWVRKFGVTVQLSDPADYVGGDLLLRGAGAQHPAPRARGSVTVYPGWCPHEIAPIVRGTRLALVAWSIRPPT